MSEDADAKIREAKEKIFEKLSYQKLKEGVDPNDKGACIKLLNRYIEIYEEIKPHMDMLDSKTQSLLELLFDSLQDILNHMEINGEEEDSYAIAGYRFTIGIAIDLVEYANSGFQQGVLAGQVLKQLREAYELQIKWTIEARTMVIEMLKKKPHLKEHIQYLRQSELYREVPEDWLSEN